MPRSIIIEGRASIVSELIERTATSCVSSGARRDDTNSDEMRLGFEPRVRGGSKRVDNFKISRLLSEFGLKLQYTDYKRLRRFSFCLFVC